MKRDYNLDLYRCICMLGVVCIHSFSWCEDVSHKLWALANPSLVGFVLISARFGIHLKPMKVFKLLGVVAACLVVCGIIAGGGRGFLSLGNYRGYWYVWAYLFIMLFSPVVDGFTENCASRRCLGVAFISIGFLLWGWSFAAGVEPFAKYIPKIAGFGSSDAIVLLCIYVQMRILVKLGMFDVVVGHDVSLMIAMIISGIFVMFGFRHCNSLFAFVFALSALLLIGRMQISNNIGKVLTFLAPSMFSVYLLHMPFQSSFVVWERWIHAVTSFPHSLCQFLLACFVFVCAVCLDMPRRFVVWLARRYIRLN